MEQTDSKQTSFGRSTGNLARTRVRSSGSLCRKIYFSARLFRIRFTLVQVCYFGFQPLVKIRIARNVSGAPAAGAEYLDGLYHRIEDERMLSHAEIVIRAPDRHLVAGAVIVGARE